ncbi:hypothetical protein [Pedobacter sp.]|uniref:hypothetical protein n=1 Tax=Pedobacter sp. TaxID=1411316 RepID=UPI003D7FC6C7
MKKIIIAFLLCSAQLCAVAQQSTNEVYEQTPVLHGDIVVLPITLVNAFPFISVEVNGVKGKFMFDTGLSLAMTINENMVKLPAKKLEGDGKFGSGQSYKVSTNDTIAEVKFSNGLTYRNLLNIRSSNYDFLQKKITPDMIGYIGHDFFKGYIFKIDYLKRKITFYKNTPQRKATKDFLNDEKVISIVNFETRGLPNHPMVKVKIGKVDLIGSFDTGQYGILQLEQNAEKELKATSHVIPIGLDGDDDDIINVNNILIGETFKTSLDGIYPISMESTEPFRKALKITESSYICFGYRFLDKYKTIWDYEAKKIYIVER